MFQQSEYQIHYLTLMYFFIYIYIIAKVPTNIKTNPYSQWQNIGDILLRIISVITFYMIPTYSYKNEP